MHRLSRHLGRWTLVGLVAAPFVGFLMPLALPVVLAALGFAARTSELSTRSIVTQHSVGVAGWALVAVPLALTYRQFGMVVLVVVVGLLQVVAFGLPLLRRPSSVAPA